MDAQPLLQLPSASSRHKIFVCSDVQNITRPAGKSFSEVVPTVVEMAVAIASEIEALAWRRWN